MAVLGILAAAVLPLGETLLRAQKERDLRQSLWELRAAIDAYKQAGDAKQFSTPEGQSGYPPSLATLVTGVEDTRPQSKGQMLYFLRRIPRDPFADPSLTPEKTWKLRSYSSPADKPEPGADVYDIRSSSDAEALDGTRYDTW